MSMTVSKLHKILSTLIEQGHGRKPICIDKATFTDPRESDGCTILRVKYVEGPVFIPEADDDGGVKFRSSGEEACRMTVVIKGDAV